MHMKKKKKNNNNKQWITYIVILCIGITIGDCIEYGIFVLDKSISAIDAISLFVTVGMTWYIATILDKQLRNRQQESSLIVGLINEVEELLKEINTLIRQEASFNEINLKIHCMGLVKQNIFDYLKKQGDEKEVEKYEESFKKSIKDIKDLLTNTPIDKNDVSKITIKKGIVKYTDVRIKEISTEMYSFKTVLFKLKVYVTKI